MSATARLVLFSVASLGLAAVSVRRLPQGSWLFAALAIVALLACAGAAVNAARER